MFFFYAYAYYWAGYLRWNEVKDINGNIFTGGQCIGIIMCIMLGTMGLSQAAPHIVALTEGKVAGTMAFSIIDHKSKIQPDEKGTKVLKVDEVKGKIELKNVNFRYPSNPDVKVLKDFNCIFEAGTTNALVGPSGSGKSTVIQLLERFYDPLSGTVEIDGEDIRNCNLRSMRHLIGYVSQEPALFNTTIRENMKFAKPDATEEEIIDALKAANAWGFIKNKLT